MAAVPSPVVTPPTATDGPAQMARSILHSVFQGIVGSPLLMTMIVLVVVVGAVRTARLAIHSRHPKDPVRRFSADDRRVIFARAGNQCESHSLVGRCRTKTGLQADHVHPHSRGGSTWLGNGQALCEAHNRSKSARVPWNWQLARLEKRRVGYFADGHQRAVVRHRPAEVLR